MIRKVLLAAGIMVLTWLPACSMFMGGGSNGLPRCAAAWDVVADASLTTALAKKTYDLCEAEHGFASDVCDVQRRKWYATSKAEFAETQKALSVCLAERVEQE